MLKSFSHAGFSLLRQPSGLVLGRAGPRWPSPYVRLPQQVRTGHMYVVGKTGKGKSKFLQQCLYQDIAEGRGCGVIDPHSDLVTDLLGTLHTKGILKHQEQWARLIYLNPADHSYVVPLNVLATAGDAYEVAQNVIEAFRRTWPESLWEAPHFNNVMLHSLLLLIKTRQTLIQLPRLLVDKAFREHLLGRANAVELTSFFHDRFDRWGKQQGALMKESSLNKVTALTMNPHLRLMLGQQENRLDFRAIMDTGKVLLVDLGQCDDESQRLIGNLITTGIEQATFTRQQLPPGERKPFYLYLDEFHDYSAGGGSGKTFSKILSGARKFGLHLTLAHQYLHQLPEEMKWAIVGNVWTKILFGVSEADAVELAQWVGLGNVDPTRIKHDAPISNNHPVYAPLAEQQHELAAQLANQPPRQAVVREHLGSIRLLWTLPLDGKRPDEEAIAAIRRRLLPRIGRPLAMVEYEIQSQTRAMNPREVWPEYDPL